MPCSYLGCNRFMNKLGRLENGSWLWLDALLCGRWDNQSGWRVAVCGWCGIETHPWNVLHKFNLFHPWKFYIYCRFDCMLACWLHYIFDPFQSFEMCIIFGVLESVDGLPQFVVCIDDGIRWCDCRLSDIFVFEEHRVCKAFGSCLFGECALRKSSDKIHPPNAHQKSFVCLVLYGTRQRIPSAQLACDYNQNCCDDTQFWIFCSWRYSRS
jgi:hypothetical protein